MIYVPPEIPTPTVDIPPEIPTTQRSCDIADIDGAEAELATLVSPVYELLLVVLVVLLDDPL